MSWVKNIFMPPGPLTPEEEKKFRKVTYRQFFQRAVAILSVFILIQIIMLYITLFSSIEDFARNKTYYLCYYSATIIGLSILLVICGNQRGKKLEELKDLRLDMIIGFAIVLATMGVTLFNQRVDGFQSNYLLGLMLYALLIRVHLRHLIVHFGLIQLVYILLLVLFLPDKSHIAAIVINSMIFMIASATISFILYNQDQQFFMQNLIIQEQNEQLYRMSYLDPVINIYNRRYLFETGAQILKHCKKTGTTFGIIMVDIDAFKEYNDCYGHPAGDECLGILGEIIRGNTHEDDTFGARYGGEEITLVVVDRTPESMAELAESLRRQLFERNIIHETSPYGSRLTVSAGVAIFTRDALPDLDMDKAIILADKALYEAKKNGRNTVCVHQFPIPGSIPQALAR